MVICSNVVLRAHQLICSGAVVMTVSAAPAGSIARTPLARARHLFAGTF